MDAGYQIRQRLRISLLAQASTDGHLAGRREAIYSRDRAKPVCVVPQKYAGVAELRDEYRQGWSDGFLLCLSEIDPADAQRYAEMRGDLCADAAELFEQCEALDAAASVEELAPRSTDVPAAPDLGARRTSHSALLATCAAAGLILTLAVAVAVAVLS